MSVTEGQVAGIEEAARRLRATALTMIQGRGAGHPGGSLSCADIVAVLYLHVLRIDPRNPADPDRDRFILSKGHASATLYAALAMRGFFPQGDLERWGEIGCHLQGHPDRLGTPGIDVSTGVLGHGVSIGAGLALSARLSGRRFRTYVLVGDGECQAGVLWEGAMAAARYRLAALTVIVDANGVQLDGFVHDVMPLEPFADKWRSFGWAVREVDGHNVRELLDALDAVRNVHDRPSVLIARTIKGKGVGFMENDHLWHGVAPTREELAAALRGLGVEDAP